MGWTDAKKELPSAPGQYLVLRESMSYRHPMIYTIGNWDGSRFSNIRYNGNVRFWMPLPERPKGEFL